MWTNKSLAVMGGRKEEYHHEKDVNQLDGIPNHLH
jgi:hypothetical protein